MNQTQIINSLGALSKSLNSLIVRVGLIEQELSTLVKLSDLARSEKSLKELIEDHSKLIVELESKLATIIIPEQTRFYLEASNVKEFNSTFARLKGMMVKFEELYKNLVAYSVTKE